MARLLLLLALVTVLVGAPQSRADGACDRILEEALALLGKSEKQHDPAPAREAALLLARAEEICPEDPILPFYAGIGWVFASDYGNAIAARGRLLRIYAQRAHALNRDPKEAEKAGLVLVLEAAIQLYLVKRPDEALARVEKVRQRDRMLLPEMVSTLKYQSHLHYGSWLVRRKRFGEAIAQTRLAIAEADANENRADIARRNLGQIYRLNDDYAEAQEIFLSLAKKYPKDGAILYGLATVYADQLKFEKAVETWKKTIELVEKEGVQGVDAPTVADARLRYGVSQVHSHKGDAGRKELLRYAEAHPTEARAWYYLGHFALDEWEEFEQAREWLEKSRALDPWCEPTLRDLKKLYQLFLPDEAKAKEIERLLEDEAIKKERERIMDTRMTERPDGTNGCK